MIRPHRARVMWRSTSFVARNVLVRFVAITASQESSPIRITSLSSVIPALFTRMSTSPKRSRAASTIRSRSAACRTSTSTAAHAAPSAAHFLRDRLGQRRVAAVGEQHVRAQPPELDRDRAPDAARSHR